MARIGVALLLGALVLVAFAVRGMFFDVVFPAPGDVVFERADGSYHLRRALYTFVNFPAVLYADSYLNHPDGSPVPWPPLYDWLLGALPRLAGDSIATFERVVAWCSPLFGALTVLPVYAIGRMLAGPGPGLGAAALYVLLPTGVLAARVGNPDHHAFVALLSATWLALSVAALRERVPASRLAGLCVGLLLVRAALVLSWSGSLLYLVLADGCLLLIALLAARRHLLFGFAASALGSAALVAPWVVASGVPTGGLFSTITLSWFHVAALVGLALVTGSVALLEQWRPSGSPGGRVLRASAIGLVALAALLAFPEPREALAPAAGFLTKTDSWGRVNNLEARALFGGPITGARVPRVPPTHSYGWFAYAIPFAVLAALAWTRRSRVRQSAACFALWALALATLAVGEVRFGSDFAPVAAVAFCLLLVEVRDLLGGGRSLATVGVVAVAVAALWPPVSELYGPQLRRVQRHLAEPAGEPGSRRFGPGQSILRFGRAVQEATPETSGYLDAGRPEYGIVCQPSMGHAFRYASRRPVPADNFGPYLDRARFESVRALLIAASEDEAVEIARNLDVRYVVSSAGYAHGRPGLEQRLHLDDGAGRAGEPHLGRFRLVTEGPERGQAFFRRARPGVPYKLFEIVPGAVLEARVAPGAPMSALVPVTTPKGRRFLYAARTVADADGVARLRVPYATDASTPARPEGPYTVRVAGRELVVEVSEEAVLEGAVISLDPVAPPA